MFSLWDKKLKFDPQLCDQKLEREEKKRFFILCAFISVKILYFEDDIFLSLCLEFIANLARKINDTRQRDCSYLGNKCLIKDLEIWQMSFESSLVLVSIEVDMCINVLWDTFEMSIDFPLTLLW